ncbi:hypothetical protein [Candidatus Manganitrophus noduliformans]|uniref:Nucleoside 2-deoxyribosyltransferase n=1 Tax=Candidatus Manganitrophus noduliformans TaxID=2606439 RepID=A0A7X6I9Q7_9BACT|nr:hypothetical protein [Candidatus Manganitrophus noduliformans]NKE69625.1 hypothetical protein [Candidatus Manganitrophus noduliformans]
MAECPICGKLNVPSKSVGTKDVNEYDCHVCGDYSISRQSSINLKSLTAVDKAKISAFTRERSLEKKPRITIVSNREIAQVSAEPAISADEIISLFPRTVSERLERALKNLYLNSSGIPGHLDYINQNDDYPILFAESREAYNFILMALVDAEWIECKNTPVGISSVTISVHGWNKLAEMESRRIGKNSEQAFVAMWFNTNLNDSYSHGFKKAIEVCGYEVVRVDVKEHNEKIDDRIISEIRKSRFLVADFTGHRGGVYFEAGFALGLGLPVIWTCRQDHKDDLHFDTRQFNHILWEDSSDLFERLRRRIEATIF